MNTSFLNPHIRYARAHQIHFNTAKATNMCYDCRFFFFKNTCGAIFVENEKYNVSSNTAVYLPPKSKYTFEVDYNEKSVVYVIDFDLVSDYNHITHSLGTTTVNSFKEELSPKYELISGFEKPIAKELPTLLDYAKASVDSFVIKGDAFRETASAYLKLCLIELGLKRSATYSNLCRNAIELVRENYYNSSLKNEDIAEKLGYHPYHLNRVFKKETGKSLKEYVIYYRLQIAKNLLLTTNADVLEVSVESGFCSPSYFTKIFKEETGVTPKEYRKQRTHTEI